MVKNNCRAFPTYLLLCRKLRLPASASNFSEFCNSGYDLLSLDWPYPRKEGSPCFSRS